MCFSNLVWEHRVDVRFLPLILQQICDPALLLLKLAFFFAAPAASQNCKKWKVRFSTFATAKTFSITWATIFLAEPSTNRSIKLPENGISKRQNVKKIMASVHWSWFFVLKWVFCVCFVLWNLTLTLFLCLPYFWVCLPYFWVKISIKFLVNCPKN